MNIYIYGDKSFKKEINKITSQLNDVGEIIMATDVKILKEAILDNPKDIFLIDSNKIIINNIFTKIFPFLNPKVGIEKVFLDENGIGGLSNVSSITDVANYISKRIELEALTNKPILMCKKPIEEINVGVVMAELTKIEDISENDILLALSDIEGLNIKTVGDTINITSDEMAENSEEIKQTIEVDSSNMNDVASLLEQLMSNKTLEISIKVKS